MKIHRNELNTLVHEMSEKTWDKYSNMQPDLIHYSMVTKLINVRRYLTNEPMSLIKDV